jgi:hypothetical protein
MADRRATVKMPCFRFLRLLPPHAPMISLLLQIEMKRRQAATEPETLR